MEKLKPNDMAESKFCDSQNTKLK